MIKIIVLSLILISSCVPKQIKECSYGDCVNGWGKSQNPRLGSSGYPIDFYIGSHKDNMRHGGGVIYMQGSGAFVYYDEGEIVPTKIRKEMVLPPPAHLVEYYRTVKKERDEAYAKIPNKWNLIVDDGLSIFRKNISGFPEEVQGKWVIVAVSFNKGLTSLETGKLLGVAHKDSLEIYHRGLGTPNQSIAQSFTVYTDEIRHITKSQIWRHNGQEGVILIEMNSYTGKIKYQLYDLDYDVKKPFAPRKKGGKYLVIHYDLRDIEIARFIVEIQ